MRENLNHPLRNVVVVGALLRVVVSLATVWPDAYPFILVAARTMAHPGSGYASHDIYPPAWFAIVFLSLGPVARASGLALLNPIPDVGYLLRRVPSLMLPAIPTPWANVGLKAPWIAADILAAVLIYRASKSIAGEVNARRAGTWWLLNPIVVLSSSVLGQYDSAVALFSLLAVCLALNGAFFGAGIAFGLGLALKPTGWVILLPLVGLVLVSDRAGSPEGVGIKNPNVPLPTGAARIAALLFGALIPLLAFIPGSRLLGVGSSLRTRLSFPTLGGINFWVIELLPFEPFGSIWKWGHGHFSIVQGASVIIGLAGAVLVVLCWLLGSGMARRNVVYVVCASALLISLQVMPLTQPHYFVVVYPFLIISGAIGLVPRLGVHLLGMLLAGYILSIWGPMFILLPVAVNHNVLPLRWLFDATAWYASLRGLVNAELSRDLRLLTGSVAVGCVAWLILAGMKGVIGGRAR
jgi:hypothetical protein